MWTEKGSTGCDKAARAPSTVITRRSAGRGMGGEGGLLLFVCVQNSGRSQMAEAFAEGLGLQAMSAGTVPAKALNPVVVEVMSEKGYDLSAKKPKMLTTDMIDEARLVITMGCSVESVCPKPILAEIQKKLIDWSLEDPRGKSIEDVRRIRNEIATRVASLVQSWPWPASP